MKYYYTIIINGYEQTLFQPFETIDMAYRCIQMMLDDGRIKRTDVVEIKTYIETITKVIF